MIHAKNNVPFYSNLFNEYEFFPEKIHSLSELSVLPVINKELIKNNLKEFLDRNMGDYEIIVHNTTGTTGQAFIFPLSRECFEREYAYKYLHYSWGGIKRGDKIAVCAGHPVAKHDRKSPPFWSSDYSRNRLILSSSHMTEKNMSSYISELKKFQPDLLMGYPSSLYLIALSNDKFGNKIRPKAIYTESETLFDFQRKAIENSFKCKVFMYYGTGEMCSNIMECEKGNYHLGLEHSYIEILDENNNPVSDGKKGKLVCTGFGNYAMPLIRYDIGDIAVFSEKETCECGRGGKLVGKIIGRIADYIITPDGRYIGMMDPLFRNTRNVILGQIVQDKIDEIIIRIVKGKNYTKREENSILEIARERLGLKVKINFEYVDEIPRSKGGKFRFVISNLKQKKFFDNIIDLNADY